MMTHMKTALILFLGASCHLAVAQTNEEIDAAWTAEDTAREAAQRVPATPKPESVDVLGRLTSAADVIFHGTVASVSVSHDANGMAYTHTTFTVADPLKGDVDAGQFTLVQEGGPGKTESDPYMMASHSRYFSVGEEEVLLLGSENGYGVREVQIRFRIYGGKVYDEDGRAVLVQENAGGGGHRLALSQDRNPAPRFSEIPVGNGKVLHKKISDPEPGPQSGDGPDGLGVSDTPAAGPGYTDGAEASALIAAIKG